MLNRLRKIGVSQILIDNSGITSDEAHDYVEMFELGQITRDEIVEELRSETNQSSCDEVGELGYKEVSDNPWKFGSEFFPVDESDDWY